jgi:RNA polymerase sigma-B factor
MNTQDFLAYRSALPGTRKKLLLSKLLTDNSRLVDKFVDRLIRRSSIRAPREDIYQAAMIGLMRAIDRLDPEKGKLSTYAAHWIRKEVARELRMHTDLYRPEGTGVPYQATRLQEQTEALHGRTPTASEYSAALGWDVTASKVEEWRAEAPHFDRDSVAKDELPGADMRPDTLLDEKEAAKKLYQGIEKLDKREREVTVLLARGFLPQEIARKLKMSVNQVVRLKKAAREKLSREM